MKIEEGRRGHLPKVDPATPYTTADGGFQGWKAVLPGGRPLATPAYADGLLFLGGGFGSYEFHALDALTGNVVWSYQTSDDGPTAAVVDEGFVVFNTESCELEVLTTAGEPVWKKWLGDPLMSMPATADGRVYMAFPDSRGDHRHYLACFGLRDGREFWRTPITGEIITAPVLAERNVYLSCLDGTMFCVRQADGEVLWHEAKRATSSPVVHNAQCYFSQGSDEQIQDVSNAGSWIARKRERLSRRHSSPAAETRMMAASEEWADYLDVEKRAMGSPQYQDAEHLDVAVGFAHFKGHAKMEQAMGNLGRAHVASVWAYQGSKPFLHEGRLYSSMGKTTKCVDASSEELKWTAQLGEESDSNPQEEVLDSVLTPPAIVNGKIFQGGANGEVRCLNAETGERLWVAKIESPIIFQPAVARGWLYLPTRDGSLYAIRTGDSNDDGWYMWGATPAHNGILS